MINNISSILLIGQFLFLTTAIGVFSYFLSKATVGIEQKTKLSSGFIGVFLVSLTTSLPEMVTAFLSPALTDAKYATYNMLGSNTLTQTTLVITFLFMLNRDYLTTFSKTNKKTNLMLIITSVWLIAPLFIEQLRITVFGMSLQLLVFLIVYFIFTFFFGFMDEENDMQEKTTLTKKQAICQFIFFALLLTVAAIMLLQIVDKFSLPKDQGGLGIGKSIAGTLFLSISTTLPEALTFIWLLKMNTHNIAINSILGSDLFNLFILGLADLFVIKGSALNFVYNSQTIDIIQRKFLFTLPAYSLMYLFVMWKTKNKKHLNIILGITTLLLFLWSFKVF